jgi:hypothetical protein
MDERSYEKILPNYEVLVGEYFLKCPDKITQFLLWNSHGVIAEMLLP